MAHYVSSFVNAIQLIKSSVFFINKKLQIIYHELNGNNLFVFHHKDDVDC